MCHAQLIHVSYFLCLQLNNNNNSFLHIPHCINHIRKQCKTLNLMILKLNIRLIKVGVYSSDRHSLESSEYVYTVKHKATPHNLTTWYRVFVCTLHTHDELSTLKFNLYAGVWWNIYSTIQYVGTLWIKL